MQEPIEDKQVEQRVFSKEEAAEYLNITVGSLAMYVSRGEFPNCRKENGDQIFFESDLIAYRERHPRANVGRPRLELLETPTDLLPDTATPNEEALIGRMISSVFAQVNGVKSISSLQETKPTIRMWSVVVQTVNGAETYQVIWDHAAFRTMKIE